MKNKHQSMPALVSSQSQPPQSLVQWHPAFYAELQIELAKDASNLIFENEHQLGTKPKEIDVLVIKKQNKLPMHSNIGKIFRTHNIVEYKSPNDYLSIDDFYRTYGYACFYKSDTPKANTIHIDDITLTFVCQHFPRKLVTHWKKQRGYTVTLQEQGIYYIEGDILSMQLIITSELSEEKNFWLKHLTNNIKTSATANKLLTFYEPHKDNILYKSVMDAIIRGNNNIFEGGNTMCDALFELNIVQERMNRYKQESYEQGMNQGISQGINQGISQGISKSIQSVIETCMVFGISKQDTLQRLVNKLSLDEDKANAYLNQYWRL